MGRTERSGETLGRGGGGDSGDGDDEPIWGKEEEGGGEGETKRSVLVQEACD
jgi:hypothetical protein